MNITSIHRLGRIIIRLATRHRYFESWPCRDIWNHFLQLLYVVCPSRMTQESIFSLKCLAQSPALVRHLSPIVLQMLLETCGSQDRNHRRYLETSWFRAPETFEK